MITAIEIENFKAFGERQRVELRPITLLFGPNSGGKSSILHALHFAREVLLRGKVDIRKTESGGDFVDLGGIRQLVYRNDYSERVKLKFEVKLGGDDLPDYTANSELQDILDINADDIFSRVTSASVELTVESGFSDPHIIFYAIAINGISLATITRNPSNRHLKLIEINWKHPVFFTPEEQAVADQVDELERRRNESVDADEQSIEELNQRIAELQEQSLGTLKTLFRMTGETQREGVDLQIEWSVGQFGRGAVPVWDRPLDIYFPEPDVVPTDRSPNAPKVDPKSEQERRAKLAEQLAAREAFVKVMSKLVVGVGQHVRDELQALRYIGPLRAIPPRRLPPADPVGPSRWPNGMAAWELLRDDEKLREQVSGWLWSDKRLDAGYRLERINYKEIAESLSRRMLNVVPVEDEAVSGTEYEEVEIEVDDLPMRSRIALVDMQKDLVLDSHDVGVGISQVVPVVTATLARGARLVAIEQPELHVHPRIQVAMGDLLIVGALGEPGESREPRCLLVETHSEHLLLRIIRRIRETAESGGGPDIPPIKPDDVAVLYVKPGPKGSTIRRLRIDETGEFVDRWPGGFFDERTEELF